MMTIVLISGSSAVAALNGAFGADAEDAITLTIVMLVPTVIGAISVAWNITDKARDHEMLARRFYRIARTITVEKADQEHVKGWQADILAVYEDEPAVFHALNAECYNAATTARIRSPKELLRVKWHHHLLRNWRRFSQKDFPLEPVQSADHS